MPEISDNAIILKRRAQLRWFVNKLLFLSRDPIILEDYDEYICFPVELFKTEKTGLFPIEKIMLEPNLIESEYVRYYATPMLDKIKKDIPKLESKDLHFDEEKFSWVEDHGYYGRGYVYLIDCIHIPLLEAYLRHIDDDKKKSGATGVSDSNPRLPIKKIEVLEDKSEQKRIIVYINGNYDRPREFSRGKNWGKMYELAMMQEFAYDKDFFDYFNYSTLNPLYTDRGGFSITKIVKVEDGSIVPNIEIKLTTQNKITRQLKTA